MQTKNITNINYTLIYKITLLTIHNSIHVMPICMASYMATGYGHAIHAFYGWCMLLGLMYILRLLYVIMCFRVMACLGF
jgi:hypothetical protein